MYIEVVPNRNSRPAVLLREGWRDGARIRKRTLANLTDWPSSQVQALRAVLKGDYDLLAAPAAGFSIERTRPHGHVAATLGTVRRLGLEPLMAPARCPERDAVVAMIVARILEPRSKLATARQLHSTTLTSTLGELLDLSACDEDVLYRAMDWLLPRQAHIEQALAKRHLSEGTLALYDVSSTYFEGRCCPLARYGYSRDGRRDKLQITFGLLTNAEGCPVAVEVFEGNTADPATLSATVTKLRQRFALTRIVLVSDRGLITSARIREELLPAGGLDWITALRAPQIQQLLEGGALQLSLFDDRDLAEISDPNYPGERLVACRNPLMAEQRARKRRELLEATERALGRVVAATQRARNPLRGQARIGQRVGAVKHHPKFPPLYHLKFPPPGSSLSGWGSARGKLPLASPREKPLPVMRAPVLRVGFEQSGLAALASAEAVQAYKLLAEVERAFRSLKSVDLKVRPIHHRLEDRVRAHVLLCMLAYYVEWHMRQALAPLLFDDDDPAAAAAARTSVVAPAQRSPSALHKAATKLTVADIPVHSFQSLLSDLATLAKNRILPATKDPIPFDLFTTPTPLQQHAFDLLHVNYRM